MPDKILASEGYGVTEDGPVIKLQVGNSAMPMTWDVAIRMGARLRVAVRNAREYIGRSRVLEQNEHEVQTVKRKAIRESRIIGEGEYSVYDDGPDAVIQVGSAKLTMTPDVGQNISEWLTASGKRVQAIYAPDMRLQFHVAQLKDGNAEDMKHMRRRDGTAAFAIN